MSVQPPFFPITGGGNREDQIGGLARNLRKTIAKDWSHEQIAADLTGFMGEAVTAEEVRAALGE
jgi:hypothetical protein